MVSGGIDVTSSIAWIDVLFIAPVMILRAWFCTLSRVEWCVLAADIQELDPYSRWGRTVPSYTFLRMCHPPFCSCQFSQDVGREEYNFSLDFTFVHGVAIDPYHFCNHMNIFLFFKFSQLIYSSIFIL